MIPRLVVRYFDRGMFGAFRRMAHVLEATAQEHCAAWTIDVAAMRDMPMSGGTGVSGHIANTHKLEGWRAIVDAAPDGAHLAFLDADTWICRSLDDVWDRSFDVAYTVRENWPVPFNLGVVFLRVSPVVRAFMAEWLAENRRMFTSGPECREWRRRFGGVNQAAFGSLLERGHLASLEMVGLPCWEWNCEDSSWTTFDPGVTRIVHLKGPLRAMAFGYQAVTPALRPVVRAWRQIDARVNGQREGLA